MYNSTGSDVAGGLAGLSFLGFYSFINIAFMCFYFLICLVSIAGFVLWILMVIDVAQREESDFPEPNGNQKTMWVLIIVLGSYVGAAIYYFLVYKKAKDLNLGKK